MFFKEKFSQFADLGNFSKYSFEQLKALVLPKYHLQTQQSDDILIATWKDCHTELVVHYTLEGKFIKIYSETWLRYKMHFARKNR
jgi:hypothetical protein